MDHVFDRKLTDAEIEAQITDLQLRTGEMLREIKASNDASEKTWRYIETRTETNRKLLEQIEKILEPSIR